jgi:anti-sigma factor RsiW
MKPNCDQFDEYLGGWLDDDARRAFEGHLADCEACAADLRLQRRIDAVLDNARPLAPHGLLYSVARLRRRRLVGRWAVAATVIACSLGAWRIWSSRPIPHDAPPRLVRETPPQTDAPPPQPPLSIAEDIPPPEVVTVDAGARAIAVAEPSSDPTVHVFWIYPTVQASLREADPANPLRPERNEL